MQAREQAADGRKGYPDVDQILRTKRGPERVPGRGFAGIDPDRQRELASKGGKAAHAAGTAHKWTKEEAEAAGRKGGAISRKRRRAGA